MDEISSYYIDVSEVRKRLTEEGANYDKPLPSRTTITAPFWDGLKRHQFLIQKCKNCEKFIWYPRAWCIYCGCRELDWVPSSRRGRIYSFVVIRQVVENTPSWSNEIPFVVAELDMEEGIRVYARVRKSNDGKINQIQINAKANIVFDDISPDVTLFSLEVEA